MDHLDVHQYRVPILFWDDHAARSPCDQPEQMAQEICRNRKYVYISANTVQLETLRSDAVFYAQGNVDDCGALVEGAKRMLRAIERPLTTT